MGQARQRGNFEQRVNQAQQRAGREKCQDPAFNALMSGNVPDHGDFLKMSRQDADQRALTIGAEIERLKSIGNFRASDIVYLKLMLRAAEPLPQGFVGDNFLYVRSVKSLANLCDAAIWNVKGILSIPGCTVLDEQRRPHIFINCKLIGQWKNGNLSRMAIEIMDTLIHELVHASGIAVGRLDDLISINDQNKRLEYITEEAVAIGVSKYIMEQVFPGQLDYSAAWSRMVRDDGFTDVAPMINEQYVEQEVQRVLNAISCS